MCRKEAGDGGVGGMVSLVNQPVTRILGALERIHASGNREKRGILPAAASYNGVKSQASGL